jgi:transposase
MHSCYLSSWFWKVKQRRGAKKAIIALSRKLLVIIYNMLKDGTEYNEEKFEIVRQKLSDRHKNRIILEAKKLGLMILDPEPVISA